MRVAGPELDGYHRETDNGCADGRRPLSVDTRCGGVCSAATCVVLRRVRVVVVTEAVARPRGEQSVGSVCVARRVLQ